jgi:4-amino-4-deoxy-L-arabinose transferase-like glycosyltransferase
MPAPKQASLSCILTPSITAIRCFLDMTIPMRRRCFQWPLLLFLLWAVAFGIRYYYVTHAQVLQPVNQLNVRGDAVDYYDYALNLSQYATFSKAPPGQVPPSGDSFRDPGYPIFLAAWMKVFSQWGYWYAAVLLSQALLSSLTVVLMVAVARRWMPGVWLVLAGLLMSIWPHSVAMCSYLLTETLFGFLIALGLFLLRRALDKRSAAWAAISGIGFSLAALTNTILIPFAPMLAAYLLVQKNVSRTACACLAIAALAVIGPWMLRNSLLSKGSAQSSSSGRALVNLVQGSWPSLHAAYQAAMRHDPDGIAILAAIDREIAAFQYSPSAGLALMGHRMAGHLGGYVWWYLSKPALLWDWDIRIGQGDIYVYPTRNSPYKTEPAFRAVAALCRAINPWLFVLAMAGAVLALLRKTRTSPSQSAAALLLLFVTLVYSVLQAEPRYSVPFRGLEILLATYSVFRAREGVARLGRSTEIDGSGHAPL